MFWIQCHLYRLHNIFIIIVCMAARHLWFFLPLYYLWKYVKNMLPTQQTFQRRFNVAVRLIWRHEVTKCQINVETTLCTSTLKLKRWATSNQRCLFQSWFEQRLPKQRFNFQRRFSQLRTTLKQHCNCDHLRKIKIKPTVKNKIILLSFKEYAGLKMFFIFFHHFRRDM